MWRAGQDPTRRLVMGAVLFLDHPPKEAELVERIADAVERSPRLRWRPDDPTFTRIRPVWVEDDDSGAEHHVRRVEVPVPGSVRQVLDLVSLLEALPFDPDRSPWDVTLIQGVEGGGAALYLRAHHVPHRRHRGSASCATCSTTRRVGTRADAAGSGELRPRSPSLRELGTITIDLTRLAQPVSAGITAAREARPLEVAVRGLQQGLDLANSISRQVLVMGGALSPAPVSHSTTSQFDVLTSPNAARSPSPWAGAGTTCWSSRRRQRSGCTSSDRDSDARRSGLRCRPASAGTGPWTGTGSCPTRVEVPTSADHPRRTFGDVAERLAEARREPALRFTAAVASAIGRLPNRLLMPALEAQADSVDLAVSAIPGVRGEPSICGAKVTAAYPFGPRLGTPLNVTAFGSRDGLDVGIAVDPGAINDHQGFRECLIDAFARLVPAAELGLG